MQIIIEKQAVMVAKDCTLLNCIKDDEKKSIYAAIVNGKLQDLRYRVNEDDHIEWVYEDSDIGKQIYERSLSFLFIAAVAKVFQDEHVIIEHALSNGLFCRLQKKAYLVVSDVARIEACMREMVAAKLEIKRHIVKTNDAITFFKQQGYAYKAELLNYRKSLESSVYELDGVYDYFYGIMLYDTSYLTHFKLRYYAPGIWLSPQSKWVNQAKLFEVFQAFEQWGRLIGITNVSQLNHMIEVGKLDEYVLMSETMAEKKLEDITCDIVTTYPNTKFIMIAGPSSAGKTTFARRLAIHLRIHGKKPLAISMDDFYHNREDCKKLADGSYDFDSLEAIDLDLFNETLLKLLHQIPVRMPIYNFKTGKREWHEKEFISSEDQIFIIEGIHGLNPQSSLCIPEDAKYKIYINALTHLNLDDHNRIPTSDYRLLRRITRDYQFRGWNASDTIRFWKNVRDAEDQYIYPYQEEANAIFNSSMVYELSVIKPIVIPLLEQVTPDCKEYLEAHRLLKLMEYFAEGRSEAIPRSSILAEFIGNSIFDV